MNTLGNKRNYHGKIWGRKSGQLFVELACPIMYAEINVLLMALTRFPTQTSVYLIHKTSKVDQEGE